MTRGLPVLVLLFACGDNGAGTPRPDSAPPVDTVDPDGPGPDANPLAEVQGTGLCDDPGCLTINPGIIEYEPRFPLYADGSSKRRWVQLPAGTQIDTSNMDSWKFPVGTKFWKEFAVGPTRVETRFTTKVLEDDAAVNAWTFISYIWNTTQDATTVVNAGQQDANGTTHDVPSKGNCKDCHESQPGRVLGFQAIQLDDNRLPVSLQSLIDAGTLTNPPTNPPANGPAGERFKLPGINVDQVALAYLHVNCGTCHNPASSTHDTVGIELRLEVGKLATVQATPAFKTAVHNDALDPCDNIDNDLDGQVDNGCPDQTLIITGVNNGDVIPFIIEPDDLVQSGLLQRMITMGIRRMPKVAVETPDPDGITAVMAWINSL